MGVLTGKRGLIVGIANERSISYSIAHAMRAAGAELALTYQGEMFENRVRSLAQELNADILCDVDVLNSTSLDNLFDNISSKWGQLDFLVHGIAYSNKDELAGRFVNTSQTNFSTSLAISCYSLIDLARRAKPLMRDGGSIITLTFQGANQVIPCYNVMGVAKAALESSVRYLASDLGTDKITVNAIAPGPVKTLAGAAIGGARKIFRHFETNAPLQQNATPDAIGGTAVYLASSAGCCTTGEIIHVDGGHHIMGMPKIESS